MHSHVEFSHTVRLCLAVLQGAGCVMGDQQAGRPLQRLKRAIMNATKTDTGTVEELKDFVEHNCSWEKVFSRTKGVLPAVPHLPPMEEEVGQPLLSVYPARKIATKTDTPEK